MTRRAGRKKARPWPVERDRSTGCLLWRGPLDADGYGDPGRGPRAHVLAFRASGRRGKPGDQIDHVCRRRACVEPRHLESVSRMVNGLRKSWAYRQRLPKCPMGHRLESPILTTEGGRVCRVCAAIIQRDELGETIDDLARKIGRVAGQPQAPLSAYQAPAPVMPGGPPGKDANGLP